MYKLSIPKSIGIVKAARLCAGIILISAFVLSFLTVPLWDYDFWWHIATGRYIVETGSLPEKDLFSYTSTLAENKNVFPVWENFILKQYWLSQIIFYLIYDYTGPKGIIILRTVLLVLTLLIVFWRLQRWSVSFPVSFIFVFTLFTLLTRSTGERPVLFTIFLLPLPFSCWMILRIIKAKRFFC